MALRATMARQGMGVPIILGPEVEMLSIPTSNIGRLRSLRLEETEGPSHSTTHPHAHSGCLFRNQPRLAGEWRHNIVMCAFYRGTADQHQNHRAAFQRVKLFGKRRKVKGTLRRRPQAARINPLLWGWNNARHHCAKKYGIRQGFAAKLHAPYAICCPRFRRH